MRARTDSNRPTTWFEARCSIQLRRRSSGTRVISIFETLRLGSNLAYFGTNSFGFSDPSPKKNFSISATKNARALGSIGVSRFSLMSMV